MIYIILWWLVGVVLLCMFDCRLKDDHQVTVGEIVANTLFYSWFWPFACLVVFYGYISERKIMKKVVFSCKKESNV